MDLFPNIHRHPPGSATSASGRSGWGSAPDKSRFHSRPQEVQHISEGRSECLGEPEEIGGFHLVQNHGLTMVQRLESDFWTV